MDIQFLHNEETKLILEDIKTQCVENTKALNEKKNKILQDFLDNIEANIGNDDFNKDQVFLLEVNPQLGAIGGEISGQTRKYKGALNMYLLTCLVDQNKDYFKNYTSLNFAMFSKHCFDNSPKRKTLITLLDNSIDWKIKNNQNPDYANKVIFEKYLNGRFQEEFFRKFYFESYKSYREIVQILGSKSRMLMREIKG